MALRIEPGTRIPVQHHPGERDVKTDADGRFVFDKVRPGTVRIGHKGVGLDFGSRFRVTAGETLDVQIGGRGRPVVGRFVPPDGVEDTQAFFESLFVSLSSDLAEDPSPPELTERVDGFESAQLQEWRAVWELSEERLDPRRKRMPVIVGLWLNGAFRFVDIPGGTYVLATTPKVSNSRSAGAEGKRVAGESAPRFLATIEVPESPGGRDDDPLDLGELKMWARRPLEVGTPAPAIEGETTDGKPITLADYRGRYVLLDFGSPGDDDSRMELGVFGRRRREYGDDQLAILSLTIAPDTPEIRDYVAKKNQHWPQLIVGPIGPDNRITRDYDIGPSNSADKGLTAAFLVGPDGTLLAKDLRRKEIDQALAKAFGR